MRYLVVGAAFLVACGGSSSDKDMAVSDMAVAGGDLAGADLAGAVDLAGADLAGDCEKPTGTHYAIGGGFSKTKLYLLGDNGWDAELGTIRPMGSSTDVYFDGFSSGAGGMILSAGQFIYSLSTTKNAMGYFDAVPLNGFSGGSHTAYNYEAVAGIDASTLVAMFNESVYCLDLTNTFDVGAVITAGYPKATGLTGTCSLAANGDFTVSFIGTSSSASRGFRYTKAAGVSAVLAASTAVINEKLGGLSQGRTVSDSGAIWSIDPAADGSTITKIRDTKLCVDAGNPFNGSKIGGLRGLVW